MKKLGFQPATIRRVSKALSSPITPPVTLRTPAALTWAASARRSARESVGSPLPLRMSAPSQTVPSCPPVPRTSVSIRKEGPSFVSAAYVNGSFSFEAGASERPPFCAKRTVPVVRSSATAPERAGATWGTLSARARRSCKALSWVGPAEVAAGATSATRAKTAARRRRLKRNPFFETDPTASRT